jgi:uncharacterized membrane protein
MYVVKYSSMLRKLKIFAMLLENIKRVLHIICKFRNLCKIFLICVQRSTEVTFKILTRVQNIL